MSWLDEPGFNCAENCINYVFSKISIANQQLAKHNRSLKLQIIDACSFDLESTQFLITDNWIDPNRLNKADYEQFTGNWFGMYSGTIGVDQLVPEKKFNCFINRMDSIRQSWIYQLIRSNIFDQGFVSFNMDISRHIALKQWPAESTPMQVFEGQFQQHLQIFQKEHDIILPKVPYRNFDKSSTLAQVIMQSEFSIVLETYFDRNDIITLSEKIFRCLKLPRPWILFAMKGAVEYLRKLGFDVLDDLVDHSYDQIDFSIERQRALLTLAEMMCNQTLTSQQIERCQQAAQHNQQKLQQMFESWHKDIDLSIDNAKTKCLT